ncbi:hypothetical protein ElyMa_004525300 [Elysia marginata]|uniref:Uncharacterized protein n=1 Tax=Elysia marginata TaxID=1093978 RepID=A0AAV4HN46_9GAST|nr:hypothetical protein ElyMa_004525300 [Elysia marginata]
MDIVSRILPSKLWIKGVSGGIIALGSEGWVFYYCIEGCANEVKTWITLFVNNDLHICYMKSPYIDIKLKHIMVCESRFISNVYRLIVEATTASLLEPCDHKADFPTEPSPTPTISPSQCQIYPCNLPMYSREKGGFDFFPSLEHDPLVEALPFPSGTVAGYSTLNMDHKHGRRQGHESHHFKTWIPMIRVDPNNLNFKFKIVTGEIRNKDECFECLMQKFNITGVQSPSVSNFAINH